MKAIYMVVEVQDGGCDCTIGCGTKLTYIEAKSLEEAESIYLKNIRDEYYMDEDDPIEEVLYDYFGVNGSVDRVSIHKVASTKVLDIPGIIKVGLEVVKEKQVKCTEQKELAEFKRLKEKYDKV